MSENESLKDSWKKFGKDVGNTMKGLGRSIAKSVDVGTDKIFDEMPANEDAAKTSDLKESWKDVGHSFGHTAADLGNAVAKSVKKGADKAEEWANEADNK